jgi:hypothetical protein
MISTAIDIARLREVFFRIFNSRNPFEPAGQEDFAVRAILFPTDVYYLDSSQFQALMGAMRDCGENFFFLSMVESEPDSRNWAVDESIHWLCEEPTYEEYRNVDIYIENALYSSDGKWGILISHEQHALLVCYPSFWDAFRSQYPSWENDKDKFIESWHLNEKETGCNIEWLNPFLAHLTE